MRSSAKVALGNESNPIHIVWVEIDGNDLKTRTSHCSRSAMCLLPAGTPLALTPLRCLSSVSQIRSVSTIIKIAQ